MAPIIGIDLGTTYSAVAVVNQHGKPEIIPNREGERTTPSVVLFDGDTAIVGSIAKRAAVTDPLNAVQFVKRFMGDPSWSFETPDGQEHSPEVLSAYILKRLKEDAEQLLGESVTEAVITVPAYFNDAQRKSTQDAGEIAGLNVRHVINEPTAAALVYGIERCQDEQVVLVYDLGGGTFDVTIMRVSKGSIDVIATGGDKNLGGFDWDNDLMNYLNAQFMEAGGSDLTDEPVLEQDLRDKAEMAKRTLSTRSKTSVFLSAAGTTTSIEVTQETFEEITRNRLRMTEAVVEEVLDDAELDWDEVDKILLVGGSTRMPMVTKLIERISGKKPSLELNPDEVVAMGAALRGALVEQESAPAGAGDDGAVALVEINDVTSHGMGVVAWNELTDRDYNSIIVERNTTIPFTAREQYHTVTDNQRELNVRVTVGDDEDLEYVTIAKETLLTIPPYPQGAPIGVTFEYTSNGRVAITVTDLTASKDIGTLEMEYEGSMSSDEIEDAKKKLAHRNVS